MRPSTKALVSAAERAQDENDKLQLLMDAYEIEFNDVFPRGYGAPGEASEAAAVIRKCMRDGKPYDPYAGGVPRDAIF